MYEKSSKHYSFSDQKKSVTFKFNKELTTMFSNAKNLLLCLFLLFSFSVYSQCPPGGLNVKTQSELNTFLIQYPDCTMIDGSVLVGYSGGTIKSNITDLTPLKNIETINGTLEISRNENLSSLTGLQNLKTIADRLQITLHIGLTDISSLSNLTSVSEIVISHNTHLLTLNGIENTPSVLDELYIWNNYRMEEISHLSHITEVNGDVSISLFTSTLSSLYGIHNIKRIGGELELKRLLHLKTIDWLHPELTMSSLSITENSILENCHSPAICRHIDSGKPIQYSANGTACNIYDTEDCNSFAVGGVVFYDTNENGVRDDNEFPVRSAKLDIDNTTYFTNGTGSYFSFFDEESPIVVKLDDERFRVTTNNEEFTPEVIPLNASIIENNIGVVFSNPLDKIDLNTTNSPMICGDNAVFTVQIRNSGSTNRSGKIRVHYNHEVSFQNINEAYTFTSDNIDNIVEIDLGDDIAPYQLVKVNLVFLVEGVTSQNEIVSINTQFVDATNEDDVYAEDQFYGLVLCSFDPNDIQVTPNRGGANFIVDDQRLQYTIRFENKGNYYAKNILVTDDLPLELDLESFELIDASHDLQVKLEGRELSFIFNDIYLPATVQDSLKSMGYISFSINVDTEKVMPSTKIENEANIYFDINPAIKTNIALATIEGIPLSTAAELLESSAIINSITTDELLFREDRIGNTYAILSADGQLVSEGTINIGSIDVSQLNSGIYFVLIYENKHLIETKKWAKIN